MSAGLQVDFAQAKKAEVQVEVLNSSTPLLNLVRARSTPEPGVDPARGQGGLLGEEEGLNSVSEVTLHNSQVSEDDGTNSEGDGAKTLEGSERKREGKDRWSEKGEKRSEVGGKWPEAGGEKEGYPEGRVRTEFFPIDRCEDEFRPDSFPKCEAVKKVEVCLDEEEEEEEGGDSSENPLR
jgi:hypothetical protein